MMIESKEIEKNFLLLLSLVEEDSKLNPMIRNYYNYLSNYRQQFISKSNILMKEELREYLRGANRYSDEFEFTDKNYPKIKSVTSHLYYILNTET